MALADRRMVDEPEVEHGNTNEWLRTTENLNHEVRVAMRRVPYPLMVITSITREGLQAGLLVSSFNTVSLNPEVFISFNIRLPSSTYEAINTSGRFTVSAISSQTLAAEFSKGYAKRAHEDAAKAEDRQTHPLTGRGELFRLECEWLKSKSVEVGDHKIMLGRVVGYAHRIMPDKTSLPLVYMNGEFQEDVKQLSMGSEAS